MEHKMCEVYSKTSDCDVKCAQLRRRVVKDLYLGDVAQRVHDLVTKNVHLSSQAQIIQYIVDVIREYDEAVIQYQNIIEDISVKLNVVLSGKGSMTVSDLKEVLTRFDVAFSTVASKLFDATRKVQDVKSVLTADGSLCMLRDAVSRRADAASTSKSFNNLRGSDFIPSQSAIAELGKQLKPTVGAAPAATGTGRPGNNCQLDQTKISICAPVIWLLLYELPCRSFRIDNEWIFVWLKHDSTQAIFFCFNIYWRHISIPIADYFNCGIVVLIVDIHHDNYFEANTQFWFNNHEQLEWAVV
ncbi:hypothetical protein ANCDUO_06045 [Ancylostoma duodenale]|uniref:Uncharacterized protein n=1 Tax=Ancylostoma duodenale TaxID=51022 RepID=A0A0C2D2Q2_9BILA|nr:hypothetical protein ANCDUO_06045 [Ancylostoma duodenale]